MALQTSGAISLADIHVEAAGSGAATSISSLNDTDIRNLTAASGYTINSTLGTEIDFADFYGASATVDYPAMSTYSVELASASGYSLTSYKSATASIVVAGYNKAGLSFRLFSNSYGVYFYVKETYSGASSTYYNAGGGFALSTTEVLASSNNTTIDSGDITHAKIHLDYTQTNTGTGPNVTVSVVNNNSWGAIGSTGDVTTSLEAAVGAECYASNERRMVGTAKVYLRGTGYNDTLVVSHDFDINCTATSNNCL